MQRNIVSANVFVMILLFISPLAAQTDDSTNFEVSGAYIFLHNSEIVDGYGIGWVGSGTWNATKWLGVAFEVEGSTQQQDIGLLDVDANFLSLLSGAKISKDWWKLRPFIKFLGGITTVDLQISSDFEILSSADLNDTRPAIQFGGGVDVPLDSNFLVRLSFDYRHVFRLKPLKQRRVLTALVYRLPFGR